MNTSRVAVVTGANRGIGAAIASRLVTDGFVVAGIHRSGQVPSGVRSFIADLTDPEAVTAAFRDIRDQLGRVAVLVANAGITRDTLVLRMREADFTEVVETNLTGTFRCVKAVSSDMLREKYGRIILISSVVASYGGIGQVNYAASKAGVSGMARSLARELGPRGITTNVIAPGLIETDMTADLPEKITDSYLQRIPVQRFGKADEIANAVSFLAAENAGYLNGVILPVDGGLGMGQ
ncbi:MAG: 3-oxoacyl-ACP reductase FabG [Bowdeniella nasicola]|nr:3-oxoacyl-ACP reductase FabG [Bowdeniella nasicola]